MKIYKDLSEAVKIWFPNFLKNSFVSSADNIEIYNSVESPYCVILPLTLTAIEQPNLRNRLNSYKLEEDFSIEFFINTGVLKDRKNNLTPFWSPLYEEESITHTILLNVSNFFFQRNVDLEFVNKNNYVSDNGIRLCYLFKRKNCINPPDNMPLFIINSYDISIDIKRFYNEEINS